MRATPKHVALVFAALALLSTRAVSAETWRQAGDQAWTHSIGAPDGLPVILKARCTPPTSVRLMHPVLRNAEPSTMVRRPLVVDVILGWGLDLRRPGHHGHRSVWLRCTDVAGCLETIEPAHVIDSLKKEWTLQVQVLLTNGELMYERFSLTGSAAAIESSCEHTSTP